MEYMESVSIGKLGSQINDHYLIVAEKKNCQQKRKKNCQPKRKKPQKR